MSAPAKPDAAHRAAVSAEELVELSWTRLFGNERPLEVEIGVGKGTFLVRRAQACPEHNFFGMEWSNEYFRYSADRLERRGVLNARVARVDASPFMRNVCPRNSITVLHVYHPDPWPKSRHRKRRLFQPPFVDAAVACLASGGRWAVQTDHAEYFEQIRALLLGHPQLEPVEFADPAAGVEAARLRTNFEIKYEREGRSIHQLAVRRVPLSG